MSKLFEQALKKIRGICLGWPEAAEIQAWGHPTFRAGKKMFALALHLADRRAVITPRPGAVAEDETSGDRRRAK